MFPQRDEQDCTAPSIAVNAAFSDSAYPWPLFPSPALSERRHRSLACRLIAVRGALDMAHRARSPTSMGDRGAQSAHEDAAYHDAVLQPE